MKKLIATLGIVTLIFSCKSDDVVVPEKLVGKWSHTYQVQYKTADGIWGPWGTINTLVAIPPIEFTSKGNFLRDGKPGAECCSGGNKFTVSDNTIIFSDLMPCPYMSCNPLTKWEIERLDTDTLVIEGGYTRNKYARLK